MHIDLETAIGHKLAKMITRGLTDRIQRFKYTQTFFQTNSQVDSKTETRRNAYSLPENPSAKFTDRFAQSPTDTHTQAR